MLVMTLTAFATGNTGHRTVTFGSNSPTESDNAVLTITDNGDNTFNVTFKDVINVDYGYTDNYGTYTFSNVAGTTENGVTTIDLSNLSASVENADNPYITEASEGVLFAKFNAEKAYARFSAKITSRKSTISAEFGVDDFESTGGGEPGGGETTEKYTVNFDKGAKSTHSGRFLRSFSLQQTGKEKQTESVSALRAAYEDHTSKVFTVEAGSELTASFNYSGEWMNGYVYIDRDDDGEFSYKEGQWDQAGTDLVAYSFYTTLPNPKVNDGNGYNSTGASVSGNDRSNVNPPSFTAPTEPGTYRIRFKIDWNCILPGGSNDILSDGGGVWDATLNVVAAEPEVTVKEEKSFTDAISMVVGDMSEVAGQAQVTIKEMTDETISMTLAVVGQEGAEYTASGFTKTVDTEKNRTTYTGTLNIEDEDYDVTALVYTDGVEKLYMVAKGAEYNYVIGTNPDAPKTPDPVDVVEEGFKATGESWKQEGVAIDWDTQYIAAKLDLSTCKISSGPENVLAVGTDITGWNDGPHYLFYYNKAAKVLQYNYLHSANKSYNRGFTNLSKAYIQLTDEVVTIEISKQGGLKINGESALVKYIDTATNPSNNSTESWTTEDLPTVFSGLWALNTIDFGGCQGNVMSNATYKYVKVVPLGWTEPVTPEVTEVSNKTYTSNLRILDGETTVVEEAEANVNIVKYSDESYKVTLKDVTLNENTQDLVFVGKALIEEAPTEATEPLTIIAKSDEATTAFFGEEMNGTFEITEVSDDEIKMEFAIEGEGVLYEGEFNYEAKTPAAEPFCKENYVADGNGFEWEIPVDWDTQKIVMSIDPSTCTGNCEDVIGLGAVPTAWVNTLHLYRTRADKMLQGYFQVPGGSNNNTDKFAETVPFLVEVSKAQGFVVNDVVKIPASEMSALFALPTVKMGTGEGANDKSRATYNYVKVVDKDWTKDPETGINATTVAEGEFEVFSVDGVKLAKLQKGLNIVRSADGKVKKVLVK